MDSGIDYKEIEYKYWADSLTKEDFLKRIESAIELDRVSSESSRLGPLLDTLYVVSCDDYYTKSSDNGRDFVRFRKGGGRYELTLKRKERNNVVRKEINLNVSNNDDSAIVEFLTLSGYSKAFQVYKEAWIWNFRDCDVSYYTLSDGRSIIELEAINYNSVTEGVESINKWEKELSLNSTNKEPRSLYEIFTEENI